jgi:putative transposase
LAMECEGQLVSVALRPQGKHLMLPEDLKENERVVWLRRQKEMAPFLDHGRLSESLSTRRGIGPLVSLAMQEGCSRASVYRLWRLLCQHGFELASLHPRFDRCGAPGTLRPINEHRRKAGRKTLRETLGEPVTSPQAGVTEKDRTAILLHYQALAKVGVTGRHLYDRIIERAYVTKYVQTESGRQPVVPPQGTFPNQRQVRHIIEHGVGRLERVLRQTTQGHYLRNLRGLRGRSYDNVPGPGYVYAIDSTIGDIHLRSSINRAWPIGRPIVYVVVDIWSTAIVGFYVCLAGPSWNTAKLALFSTLADPRLIADMWGIQHLDVLRPAPTAPSMVLSDRGEYLSTGARETCLQLAINTAINPPYRPDLKGLVEVLHRIEKDEQYRFLPGAIDARRRELELKPNAKESALTLREYLFADRSDRMTSEMIAVGAEPTPAGLWRFGHEVGCGYRKANSEDRLITSLLQRGTAVSRRDGLFFESLQYEGELATTQQWSGLARNFGVTEHVAYHFPGSTSRIWVPESGGGLHRFNLKANARVAPDVSLDEWRDALMYEKTKNDDRQYKRLAAALAQMEANAQLRKRAVALTKDAEAAYEGPKPNFREARVLENLLTPGQAAPADSSLSASDADDNVGYESLMDEVFASINRGDAA